MSTLKSSIIIAASSFSFFSFSLFLHYYNRLLSGHTLEQWLNKPTHICNNTLDIIITWSKSSLQTDLHDPPLSFPTTF